MQNAQGAQDSQNRVEFQQLPAIPDLTRLYLGQAFRALPLLGGTQRVVDDPRVGFRVSGVRTDPGQLAAYCSAVGFALGDALPASFPYLLSFPLAIAVMDAPGFPFPAMGAVHLSNVITQHRPVHAGESLGLEVFADNLRAHRKGLVIDMHTRLRAGGELAWEQTSSFLSVGATWSADTPEHVRERPEDSCRRAGTPLAARELFAHTAAARLDFSPSGVKEYARASGDKNPIHVSRLGARAFGFPAPIAHGMLSFARVLAFAGPTLPQAGELRVDFYKPLVVPGRASLYVYGKKGASPSGASPRGATPSRRYELRSARTPEKLHAVVDVQPLS
ncbi:MaoC/PaaZ C-terminal domain-containing protein [Corynebacterium sp.]|uniref:MaoC/PaaZ C-terminal domain-containing protein n=1 Tax=Corynebacterium sp. TaxID=1720 RepID=UPI0026DBA603|nr:MaoC/PaaZ C-terminal domain-containing protein [Corynebacterium sp.]MDO5032446.1 MaoC/PaaZ C-terminal domain-containing protein [Corynebacterium sp.]